MITAPSIIDRDVMERWLRAQLSTLQKSLLARQQSAETWRGGDEKAWRSVGCRITKAQRLEEASIEDRIAAKIKADIVCVQALIEFVHEGQQ